MGKKTAKVISQLTTPSGKNLSVLVTRPIGQQAELLGKLDALGVSVLSKPLIAIEGLAKAEHINTLKQKIQNFAQHDIAIFISTNAAHYGGAWIDEYWPQFPENLEVIAIGPSTALTLEALLPCRVSQPSSGSTSEDVLALPSLKDVSGKRVAIFRGCGGRELLASTLKDRGAIVEYFEVYTRESLSYNSEALASELTAHNVNILSANSSETVRLLKDAMGNSFSQISDIPLLVPSRRVACEAEEFGFTQTIDCAGASPDAFVAALLEIADTV